MQKEYEKKEEGKRTKPPPIRLHPPRHHLILPLLKRRSLDDLPIFIPHRFPARQHLEAFDLFGIAVEVLAFDFFEAWAGFGGGGGGGVRGGGAGFGATFRGRAAGFFGGRHFGHGRGWRREGERGER